MKVLNVHTRIIYQPIAEISKLFETLATKDDQMLATDKWPAMKLDKGLQVGSKGGHGIIRYSVQEYTPGKFIQFKFSKPKGFDGVHEFKINELESYRTELKHSIKMNIKGQALFTWPLAIKWLHDAYIEDAFDRVENHFLPTKKTSKWNFWVRLLRKVLKPRKRPT